MSTPVGEPLRRIVILAESSLLKELDRLLWTFSGDDFLPHCYADHESAFLTPIVLVSEWDEARFSELPHADVLIHLNQNFLENAELLAQRFPRMIEVVSLEEQDLLAGRERYKRYRALGFELQNYDQKGAS